MPARFAKPGPSSLTLRRILSRGRAEHFVLKAALLGQPSHEAKLCGIRFSNIVNDNRLCSGLLCRFVHPRPLLEYRSRRR